MIAKWLNCFFIGTFFRIEYLIAEPVWHLFMWFVLVTIQYLSGIDFWYWLIKVYEI